MFCARRADTMGTGAAVGESSVGPNRRRPGLSTSSPSEASSDRVDNAPAIASPQTYGSWRNDGRRGPVGGGRCGGDGRRNRNLVGSSDRSGSATASLGRPVLHLRRIVDRGRTGHGVANQVGSIWISPARHTDHQHPGPVPDHRPVRRSGRHGRDRPAPADRGSAEADLLSHGLRRARVRMRSVVHLDRRRCLQPGRNAGTGRNQRVSGIGIHRGGARPAMSNTSRFTNSTTYVAVNAMS